MSDIQGRTYQLAVRVVKLCGYLEQQRGTPQILAKQLLRSGTSVGANVREAQSAESDRDFLHKLSIALKEARETEYWLQLLIDSELVPPQRLTPLLEEVSQVCKILITITQKLKFKIRK